MPWVERRESIDGLYTLEACARELGLSKKTVYYRVMRFRLPVVRVGNTDLVKLEDVRDVPLYGRGEMD